MKNMMNYKGYYGSINTDLEGDILYGKLEFIRDLVSYEGKTPKDIKIAFEEAVDDYLDTCEKSGQIPEKPLKGSFNIRIGSELHELVAIAAFENNISLNEFVKISIEKELRRNSSFKENVESKEENNTLFTPKCSQ